MVGGMPPPVNESQGDRRSSHSARRCCNLIPTFKDGDMSRFALFLIFFAASSFAQNSEATKFRQNDPPADVPAAAVRSTFLMMGNRAGQQAVWKSDDGVTHRSEERRVGAEC